MNGLKKLGFEPGGYPLRADQPRSPRPRGRREAAARAVRRSRADDRGRLGHGRARQPARGSRARDLEITDGQKLTLGDTTLTMYVTPGHTNGTVSTLIPLRDGAAGTSRRSGAARCSTSGRTPRASRRMQASAARLRDIATAAGADVLLSNHTDYDGTKMKLPALATRAAGCAASLCRGHGLRSPLPHGRERVRGRSARQPSLAPLETRHAKHKTHTPGFRADHFSPTGWESHAGH